MSKWKVYDNVSDSLAKLQYHEDRNEALTLLKQIRGKPTEDDWLMVDKFLGWMSKNPQPQQKEDKAILQQFYDISHSGSDPQVKMWKALEMLAKELDNMKATMKVTS